MMPLVKIFKDPKTIAILLAGHALALSIAAMYLSAGHTPSQIATADMQMILDSQKLLWVKRMKEGDANAVLKDSGKFQQKLQFILNDIAKDNNVVIIDKSALIAGRQVMDVTPLIIEALGISTNEVELLRRRLEEEILSDFPAMRKDRP